jgi:hypothetical protein
MHGEHVDDVGPIAASLVAVAEQLRGDRIPVGLVVDQDAAEMFASLRVERFRGASEGPQTSEPGGSPKSGPRPSFRRIFGMRT